MERQKQKQFLDSFDERNGRQLSYMEDSHLLYTSFDSMRQGYFYADKGGIYEGNIIKINNEYKAYGLFSMTIENDKHLRRTYVNTEIRDNPSFLELYSIEYDYLSNLNELSTFLGINPFRTKIVDPNDNVLTFAGTSFEPELSFELYENTLVYSVKSKAFKISINPLEDDKYDDLIRDMFLKENCPYYLNQKFTIDAQTGLVKSLDFDFAITSGEHLVNEETAIDFSGKGKINFDLDFNNLSDKVTDEIKGIFNKHKKFADEVTEEQY